MESASPRPGCPGPTHPPLLPGLGGDDAGILVGGDLWQPEVLHSQDGLLQVKIVAAQQEVDIRGCQAQVLAYNGTIPGWTWRVSPGD